MCLLAACAVLSSCFQEFHDFDPDRNPLDPEYPYDFIELVSYGSVDVVIDGEARCQPVVNYRFTPQFVEDVQRIRFDTDYKVFFPFELNFTGPSQSIYDVEYPLVIRISVPNLLGIEPGRVYEGLGRVDLSPRPPNTGDTICPRLYFSVRHENTLLFPGTTYSKTQELDCFVCGG